MKKDRFICEQCGDECSEPLKFPGWISIQKLELFQTLPGNFGSGSWREIDISGDETLDFCHINCFNLYFNNKLSRPEWKIKDKLNTDPSEDTFFVEHGKYFLKLYSYGEIDEFTVEELYQAFKKRFIRESG